MPLQVINCVKIPSARIAAIRLIRSGWHLNIVGISDVTGFRMALILTGSLKCVKQPNCHNQFLPGDNFQWLCLSCKMNPEDTEAVDLAPVR